LLLKHRLTLSRAGSPPIQALDTSGQSITQALNAVAGSAASSSALASQSLGQVAPLQTTLKVIVYAFAAVAIVYFLSRDAK
jgi:hypothetical protein